MTKLKKLGICRDTYPIPGDPEVEEYFSYPIVSDADRADARLTPELNGNGPVQYKEIFERAHRIRMLVQAEKYAAAIPILEWIYCGQWPMAIEKRGGGTFRAAIPLTKERDTCRMY